jgi:hypothetical protein
MSKTRSIIRLLALAGALGVGAGTLAAGPVLQAQAQDELIVEPGESTKGHDHYKNGMRWCHCDAYDSACLGCVTEAPATEAEAETAN